MFPWRLAFCALVSALAASAPCSASAAPPPPARTAHPKPLAQTLPPEAKGDYDAGKILFEDGDFQTSRIKFQAAYDLTHDARLLWNIAVCQKNERHYAKALATLARYLADGGDLLTPGDRHDAQDLSTAITPFTSAATIQVSEDGAQLWVDDTFVGTTPLTSPVRVDLGPRKVRAKKDGFRVFDKEIAVGGNATVTIDVAMERQSGRLELRLAAPATVSIDGKEIGKGPMVDADLPVGGHELLVTAPGMRPYQGDLVIEDGRTRAFDVTLERAPAPVSEVRVAVGCSRPEAGAPEDGLSVFFDGARESAPAFGTRRRTEDGSVSYVPYAVDPGRHTVRVALAECDARDTTIDAPVDGTAKVTGMLPSSRLWLDGSPAGSPSGWRVSAGVTTMSQTFSNYSSFYQPPASIGLTSAQVTPASVAMHFVGPMVTAGLEGRWFTLLADARVLFGRADQTIMSGGGVVLLTPPETEGSSLTFATVGVRPGLRLPLLFGALTTGFVVDVGMFLFSPDYPIAPSQTNAVVDTGVWAALDVKPVCDIALQAGLGYDVTGITGFNVEQGGATTTWVHLVFEPNATCRRARSGAFHIEGSPR
jgi:PEGA domain